MTNKENISPQSSPYMHLNDENEDYDKDYNDSYEYEEGDTDTVLIDVIQNYAYIYDKSQSDFKDAYKKDRTWSTIASILKLSGKSIS